MNYYSIVNELLQQTPEEIQSWLKEIDELSINLLGEYEWSRIAEVAASRANSESNLLWAEISVSVYERLALLQQPDSYSKERYMISCMLVRANMIREFGNVSNHFILDIDKVVSWFSTDLWFSLQEIEKKVENRITDWISHDIDEVRKLRKIKNRLTVISALADSDKYELSPEIKHWLSLRQKLP